MFCYLHWHSHFSLLRAIWSPKQIINQAQLYQLNTLALTDYDSVYGAIEFYQWCQKNNIKPIIWVQLVLVSDLSQPTDKQSHSTITVIACNQSWYHQILKLVSDAHTIGFFEWPRIDITMITAHIHDCVITLWGHRSYLSWSQNPNNVQYITQQCRKIQDTVWINKFAIEYTIQDYDYDPELQYINELATGIAAQLGAPLVWNPDYHYIHAQDRKIYEIALCIKDGQTLYDKYRKKLQGNHHMMSSTEIHDMLQKHHLTEPEIQNIFTNNQSISDQCQVEIQLGALHFPQYQSSTEIHTLYEHYLHKYLDS